MNNKAVISCFILFFLILATTRNAEAKNGQGCVLQKFETDSVDFPLIPYGKLSTELFSSFRNRDKGIQLFFYLKYYACSHCQGFYIHIDKDIHGCFYDHSNANQVRYKADLLIKSINQKIKMVEQGAFFQWDPNNYLCDGFMMNFYIKKDKKTIFKYYSTDWDYEDLNSEDFSRICHALSLLKQIRSMYHV